MVDTTRETVGETAFHYTDKDGWNAIRAQTAWSFKASQPKDPDRPFGAYFTSLAPTAENLRTLHKRIRIPKIKQGFVFWFSGRTGLQQHRGGRGRDRCIFFSPTDYYVSPDRQKYAGATESIQENFE